MEKDTVLLGEVKALIEEMRKSRVPRETIDKCFGIYHANISRNDIGYEEKVYLCIMNGLAYMKVGSYLSADGSYLLARTYANDSNDIDLIQNVGYEILFFYANSRNWVFENKLDVLVKLAGFGTM